MKVFVACSGVDNVPCDYRDLASEVATMLARNNHKLVFGGVDTGMMGKCYMAYKYEGGKVKAVVELHDAENLEMLELDAYEVKPTVFERTKELYNSSDVVIFLPGGLGTYGEIFSMLDEKRQKKQDKKIILFNYNHFYTPLLRFLSDVYKEGFVNKSDLQLLDIVTDVKSLELFLRGLEKENE